jgi:hypothetical protein
MVKMETHEQPKLVPSKEGDIKTWLILVESGKTEEVKKRLQRQDKQS